MFSPSDFGDFFKYLIMYVIGFVLGSYGGLFSESAGIINIALEGSMVFGAFAGIIFLQGMNTWCAGSMLVTTAGGLVIVYLLAVLIAILAGILFSFLLSFVSIKLKADQTVVGTALNSLAIAICTIFNTSITGIDSSEVANNIFSNVLSVNVGTDGFAQFINHAFSGLNISVLIGLLAIVVLWLVMNKMRFGLRLRACGENPAAADSVGINVYKMRYMGTAIGSAAAALSGFVIFSCMPIGTWQISALGYGFLVLAIEIFGNWKATSIIFCSLFFALFFSFAPTFSASISNHPEWGLNRSIFGQRAFYYLLPYFLALLTLVIFSKKSRAPKAEGIPYDKSSR